MASIHKASDRSYTGYAIFVNVKFAVCTALTIACDIVSAKNWAEGSVNLAGTLLLLALILFLFTRVHRANGYQALSFSTLLFLIPLMRKVFSAQFRATVDASTFTACTSLLIALIIADVVNGLIAFKNL